MKKLLTIYLILSSFISFSQNETGPYESNRTIDSLRQILKNYDALKLEQYKNLLPGEGDSARVKILLELSWEHILVSEFDVAKKYSDEALAIAKALKNKNSLAKAYHITGTIYYYMGNYPEALENHFIALKIREDAGDKKGIGASCNNIGLSYWQQGNNPEALKYYLKALRIWEETGNKSYAADAYNNIGLIYVDLVNYSEALKNYFASLKIKQEIGDQQGISHAFNNIGIVYYEQGNYSGALENYTAALEIKKKLGDKFSVANAYFNTGNVYSKQGNFQEALKNYFASLEISREIGDKNGIAMSYNSIGSAKLEMHEARESKEWLMKGLELSKQIEAVPLLQISHEALAGADSALGNFKDAYEHYKLSVFYRDSLNNEKVTKKTLQTKMQYEFDKKEAETKAVTDAELKKQKLLRNGFVGGFVAVLLFAGILFGQRNKIRKEKRRTETALDELKTAQQKLVEKEKLAAVGMLAQRMAHEIQNPLNFVNNFSELSEELTSELEIAKTDEERLEIISRIKVNMSKINQHGKRADGIIKNLQRHLNEGKGLDLLEK